jgi:putative effector of murein hydrolase LrgA (UPF0299 family)
MLAAALLYTSSASSTTSAFAPAVQRRADGRPLTALSASAVVPGDQSLFGNDKVAAIAAAKVAVPRTTTNNNSNAATVATFASTALFILMDMAFKALFQAFGISFPSSLAGCGVLFSLMLAVPSSMGENIYKVLKPGAGLLAKWLQVFLVPSLVRLPLAPALGSTMEVRVSQVSVCQFSSVGFARCYCMLCCVVSPPPITTVLYWGSRSFILYCSLMMVYTTTLHCIALHYITLHYIDNKSGSDYIRRVLRVSRSDSVFCIGNQEGCTPQHFRRRCIRQKDDVRG